VWDSDEIETQLIHASRGQRDDSSVATPIFQTSTFTFDDPAAMAKGALTPNFETFYTRYGNPNHADVERLLATIEGGEAAMVMGSGMGGITTTALSLVGSGDHVVAQRFTYAGTHALLTDVLPRFGVSVTLVDQTDTVAFAEAMRPETKLVMLESPSNPLLGIIDIEAVSRLAHERGALVSIDSTIATPINQNPLRLGADIVLHSATKYLGGHSDLIAGAVVTSQALIDRIWKTHIVVGSVLGPFEAWLLLRGLRTLDMRVDRQNRSAQAVAEHLAAHPRISRVFYPGLPSHPGHAVAARQMRGFGGLLSFEIDGSFDDARRAIANLRLIRNAVSLGGIESLVVQPAAMWPDIAESREHADALGVTPSLVRLSVGTERVDDLIADLDNALAKL
jgi:methionine-gamma-lyase